MQRGAAREDPHPLDAGQDVLGQGIYADVEVVEQTTDTLSFRYRETASNRLRVNTFRWFTPTGGVTAEFEMSVVGRQEDVPGLDALLAHVSASVHQVP